MDTYRAEVSRDGKFWLIHVSGLDRWTQARTYGEIESMARDLIAIVNGVPEDSFELTISIRSEQPAAERAAESRAAGLAEMVRQSEEAGLYDLPEDAVIERLPTSHEASADVAPQERARSQGQRP